MYADNFTIYGKCLGLSGDSGVCTLDCVISMASNTRFSNIDLMESIAMFFVIVYHTITDVPYDIMEDGATIVCVNYCIRSLLSVCVPLFYFCNGFLLFNRSFVLQRHLYKTAHLLLLSLFWGLISAYWSQYIIHYVEPVGLKEFVALSFLTRPGWNNHLWFLHTLIIIYIFFPFLKIVFDRSQAVFKFGLIMTCVVILGNNLVGEIATIISHKSYEYFNFLGPYNPINMASRHALMYFMLGGYIGLKHKSISSFIKAHHRIIFPFSVLLILIMCVMLGGYGIALSNILGRTWDNVFEGYGTVFTAVNVLCFYVLTTCYSFSHMEGLIHRIVYLISLNTLGIYFLHDFFVKAYYIYIYPILSQNNLINNHFEKLLLCTIIILLSLLVSLTMKKIPGVKQLI